MKMGNLIPIYTLIDDLEFDLTNPT